MRYLKNPAEKKKEPTINWDQKSFTNIYKDIPASEIPEDGISNAVNVLLFGHNLQVRPGDELHSSTVKLPLNPEGQIYLSGISKTNNIITSVSFFGPDIVGSTVFWPISGEYEEIIEFIDVNNVRVDSSAIQTDTLMWIRDPIWGNFWHEKSKLIFIHIYDKIYYTTWNFSQDWTEIVLSGGGLDRSRSKFDSEENTVYVFNLNGIYSIDVTDISNISILKINQESPNNTMSIANQDKGLSPALLPVNFQPTEIETSFNTYGRRYLYSLMKLNGKWTNNRGDGSRIIKETGSNKSLEVNDFKDYFESWRPFGFDTADLIPNNRLADVLTARTDVLSGTIPNQKSALSSVNNMTNGCLRLVINGPTLPSLDRDVIMDFVSKDYSWTEIAKHFQKKIRRTFPEYKYLKVAHNDDKNKLMFFGGEVDVTIVSIGPSITATWGDLSQFFANDSLVLGEYNSELLSAFRTIGKKLVPALDAPIGSSGYTHYGVYSTLTDGPDFRVSGNSTINLEQFAWQKDIPIIKPFNGIINSFGQLFAEGLEVSDLGSWIQRSDGISQVQLVRLPQLIASADISVHNDGFVVSSNEKKYGNSSTPSLNALNDPFGFFTTGDAVQLHDYVFNKSTLQGAYVTFVSPSTLALSEDIFQTAGDFYSVGGEALAIGGTKARVCQKIGNSVSKLMGADFTFPVKGQYLFWDDGDIDLLDEYLSPTQVTVFKSETKPRRVCSHNIIGRNYNDSFTDLMIGSRLSSFSVDSIRFLDPFPNSDIGALVPGFMSVSKDGDTKGYYSLYNSDFKYIAGHYKSDIQFFNINDSIKELSKMPDHLIVFCKNSTHKFQTNVTNDIQGLLSGQSVVDENIGISDRVGITSFGAGFKLVITSEPGIRIFDGYKYNENKLIDNNGRSHLRNDFQILKERIVIYYEPNLYGLMFWGINNKNKHTNGTPVFGKTNKCYRLALDIQQGFGFSELNGEGWNFIHINSKPMLITNNNGTKITILLDSKAGYPHRLSTRKISEQGLVSEKEFNFTDNEPVGGGNSIEISWLVRLKEHIAQEEQMSLRYLEEYWYLRPNKESNKNQIGYDKYGYRIGQKLTIKKYTDGNALEVSESHTFDPKATIFQPYNVEERRIQTEISGTRSELIIIGTKALYDVLNRREPPGSQNETIYQDILQKILFRISRGYPKTINLVTGLDNTNQLLFLSETIGPDQRNNSAFKIINGSINYPSFINNFRQILFSIKVIPLETDCTIYDEYISPINSKLKIILNTNSGNFMYFYFNNLLIDQLELPSGWNTFMVTISNDSNKFFVDIINSSLEPIRYEYLFSGSSSLNGSEIIIIGNQPSDYEYFDFIIRDFTVSPINEDAFLYYGRDIYKYKGFSLFPSVETIEYFSISNNIIQTGMASDNYIETGTAPDNIIEQGV